ncbi:MAG: hypothetical protein JWP87_5412 [Labilithrix sp.]|nr:hypothetical protein [Labilithrix sp.]
MRAVREVAVKGFFLLAGLTFASSSARASVTVAPNSSADCPDQAALEQRLRSAGVTVRNEDDVRVHFSVEDGKRVATIEMPSSEPRRITHDGADCASLADAAVALLSVLLDERATAAPPPNARTTTPDAAPTPTARSRPLLRAEGALVYSSGIVAPDAAGISAGVALRPLRWASLGLAAEIWPSRDSALAAGDVTLGASTLALAACAGPTIARTGITIEGCVLAHGGFYSLSARGFPNIHSETRALFGGEADVRAALPIAGGIGIVLRGGVWVPLTRLDVTVRGASSGFATTSVGPKAGLGVEMNF